MGKIIRADPSVAIRGDASNHSAEKTCRHQRIYASGQPSQPLDPLLFLKKKPENQQCQWRSHDCFEGAEHPLVRADIGAHHVQP